MAPVARYYAGRLRAHGSTAGGVDWSSEDSQQLRFTQLLRLVEGERGFTVLDYGCGYGALAPRLLAAGASRYVGFDVCAPMIAAARAGVRDPRCAFADRAEDLRAADYVVASGVFNVKLDASEARWQAYVAATLAQLAELSRRGFACNLLSRYADPERMREDLYYADPGRYLQLCKERFSREVALLHDYGLYEFTLLVRLGAEPKPLVA